MGLYKIGHVATFTAALGCTPIFLSSVRRGLTQWLKSSITYPGKADDVFSCGVCLEIKHFQFLLHTSQSSYEIPFISKELFSSGTKKINY